jgi:ABC-type transporter Mla MlaB component
MNENIIVNSNAVGIPDEVFYKIIRNQEEQLREYIFVKGNFGFVGRPFAAIDLLCELSEIIKSHGLQIVIVSVPEEIRSIIKSQLEIFGLQHQIFGSGQLKRNEIFSLLSKSVVYLGFSLSDGLSTTAIEAMACGAIPFQTKSSTIFEWDSSMKCHMVDLNNMHVSKLDLADILENRKNNSEIITYNQNFIQKNFLASVVKKKVSQSIENMYD